MTGRILAFARALAFAVAAIAALTGCNRIPEGRMAVNELQIRGADKVHEGEIEDAIATTETQKFLGLFRGVLFEYALFDRFVLQRDLARVEAYYHAQGYYHAKARAGRVHVIDDKRVRVEIVIEEGPPVLVRNVRVDGTEELPEDVATAVRKAAAAGVPRGRPFVEKAFEDTRTAVRRALSDRGYAYAKVEYDAAVDIVEDTADVIYTVTAGPVCRLGPIAIEGLGSLPEDRVRRTLDLKPGARFSEDDLESAQQALLDLGVFASVTIEPKLEEPPRRDAEVPLLVTVEPTRLRTVRLGGGLEFDALKTDIHGIIGWENRNFLGGLRTFSINFRPGFVLYPVRINNLVTPERLLPEERLRVDLRQPGFLEARTTGFVRPELNVYPVLLNPNPPPNAPVLGYLETKNAVGLDRTMWRLFGAVSHNLHVAHPFSYLGPRDPTLGLIFISFPELLTQLDFRDDPVQPRRGALLRNTLQFAGGPFGGNADDVKVQPDVRAYVPLSRRVVFATRASVGFLWPRNYGDTVQRSRTQFPDTGAAATRDYQLTFFRGFFSGGPTQNRGYPLRGVGPHDFIPFLTPEFELQRLEGAAADDARVPSGGFTLWEASAELRFEVTGPLSVATFCDASDVSPRQNNIRLTHLHLSCGAGGRYDTPVGPIRLDVGYRIPGLQVIGGLTPDEREPRTFPLGIPIAVHIGIGEAY
jgi:outer membrane protein assembly factor BamA